MVTEVQEGTPKIPKSPGQELFERLGRKTPNVWEKVKDAEREAIFTFAEGYKSFLTRAKTERLAAKEILRLAAEAGVRPLEGIEPGQPPAAGAKFSLVNRGKEIALIAWGREPLASGLVLVGAHLDSPRLDLKPQPLYESQGLALLKTHYYGGIKKYQWVAMPLALYGVVIKATGETLELCIGEDPGDPAFTITDLLPHLAKDQVKRLLMEGIAGEELNVLVGSIPYADEDVKEKVKLAVLDYLNRQYGLVEEDFISAELELVPAGPARDLGWDRSLVAGYGQDDRSSAYAGLRAFLDLEAPAHTAVLLLVDKEEIGSIGNTAAQSNFLQLVVDRLSACEGKQASVREILRRSKALSADVAAAQDPTWEDVMDKYNAARLGGGVVLSKYTGAGGKYNANDAHAEYVAQIRQLFNANQVIWQTGELGKVDQGGGGTIAGYLANLGLEVVDCGPALLGMHSPFEVSSKADIYMSYRAYQAFFNS